MQKTGIAVFAYNRPSHLRRVLIALEDLNINVTPIGDCKKVGYIHGAIADARNAVINF